MKFMFKTDWCFLRFFVFVMVNLDLQSGNLEMYSL